MSRYRKVHYDATKQSGHVVALCGWTFVTTTHRVENVTCKVCKERLVEGVSDKELSALALPKASSPPKLTSPLWQNSCRGALYTRCDICALCVWEKEAERWYTVAPWNDLPPPTRVDRCWRWSTVYAALSSYYEWLVYGKDAPSASGSMLDRAKRGSQGGQPPVWRDVGVLVRADDFVHVEVAVDHAFPPNGHARLSVYSCRYLLRRRVAGDTYDALAQACGESVDEVKAIVRFGRRQIESELVWRGLVKPP